MTTPRTRRTPEQQAAAPLNKLLARQKAKAAKTKAAWEADEAAVATTHRMLEVLGMERLPGLDTTPEEPPKLVCVSRCMEGTGIGEKANGINDVWNAKEGNVTVHSALMYERDYACEWCYKGVPFATEERIDHYIVTRDEAGVERGFEYKPCSGVI